MQTSLRGIANKAASDPAYRFRNLMSLLTVGFLLHCWTFVNKRAAAGVDRIDARVYAHDLEHNVATLVASVKGGWYRAKLVLRNCPLTTSRLAWPDGVVQIRTEPTSS